MRRKMSLWLETSRRWSPSAPCFAPEIPVLGSPTLSIPFMPAFCTQRLSLPEPMQQILHWWSMRSSTWGDLVQKFSCHLRKLTLFFLPGLDASNCLSHTKNICWSEDSNAALKAIWNNECETEKYRRLINAEAGMTVKINWSISKYLSYLWYLCLIKGLYSLSVRLIKIVFKIWIHSENLKRHAVGCHCTQTLSVTVSKRRCDAYLLRYVVFFHASCKDLARNQEVRSHHQPPCQMEPQATDYSCCFVWLFTCGEARSRAGLVFVRFHLLLLWFVKKSP